MDVTVGTLLALATAVLWGSREILLRKAFEATKPVHGLLATIAATFIISFIAAFFYESGSWNRLTLSDVLLWATIGVLHFPVAMALYYLGIDSVGASRTSVVSNVSAIVTPLLGMALLAEVSTPNVVAGVFVAGAGIFIVSSSSINTGGWRWQKGIVYALLAGLTWSATNLLTRFGFAQLRLPMTALAIVSGVPLLPVALFIISRDRGAGMVSDMRQSPQLAGGSFLSGLGQVTLFAALFFAPTIYVVPTYNLKSLVTVFLAYLVIPKSERVNARVILGAILAIGGIILINL
jgi:drug/metabolite transporter (DMT)-like permease